MKLKDKENLKSKSKSLILFVDDETPLRKIKKLVKSLKKINNTKENIYVIPDNMLLSRGYSPEEIKEEKIEVLMDGDDITNEIRWVILR